MPVCRPEILPALAMIGITEEAALDFGIPEPVLDDLADVAALLPEGSDRPEIEIDDDGSAVLRWFSADMRTSFSLTFLGLGSVAGNLSSDRLIPAWRMPISQRSEISARLREADVAALVSPLIQNGNTGFRQEN